MQWHPHWYSDSVVPMARFYGMLSRPADSIECDRVRMLLLYAMIRQCTDEVHDQFWLVADALVTSFASHTDEIGKANLVSGWSSYGAWVPKQFAGHWRALLVHMLCGAPLITHRVRSPVDGVRIMPLPYLQTVGKVEPFISVDAAVALYNERRSSPADETMAKPHKRPAPDLPADPVRRLLHCPERL